MELNHFSHEHRLILNEEPKDDGKEVMCSGCQEPILGPNYGCSSLCDFFLHKTCAELPREIKQHPFHPLHPLTLHSIPPYSSGLCLCDSCRGTWERFTYNCSLCVFDICISCALMERRIEHASHKHPLTLQLRPALFYCDACGTEDKDLSYLCTTCPFWIHKSCASLPNTYKHGDHDHHLTLAYSIPDDHYKFNHSCEICSKKLRPHHWVYYCADCRHFVHVKCATSETTEPSKLTRGSQSEIKVEEGVESDLIRFPVESEDLISLFRKIGSGENQRATDDHLNHFSHDHPLILFEVQQNNEIRSDEALCAACVQPITASFYGCSQFCSFFLHKSCAELPEKLRHPSHSKHLLSLVPKDPESLSLFCCGSCSKYCNGFKYKCDPCSFKLDVRCAFLPDTIAHEAHKHPLVKSQVSNYWCNACGNHKYSPGFKFGCETCGFHLDNYCALLPRTVRHRWDEHPLTLIYPPFNDHPQEFYCEVCEEDIHPRFWQYHCRDCDQSFHTTCLRQNDPCSSIKFGGTFKLDRHPHVLTLVRKTKDHSRCNRCRQSSYEFALDCAPCNFQICPNCFPHDF